MALIPDIISLHRRSLLVGLAAGVGAPCAAGARARPVGVQPWLDYEQRLQERLVDAGGGLFQRGVSEALLQVTNAARRSAGRLRLEWSEELALAARAHAADLASRRYLDHLSPEGFDPSHRVSLLSRRLLASASENIAARTGGEPPPAADLLGVWRKSPPHWVGLMKDTHTHAAFGVVQAGLRTIAVGLYARPDGELVRPAPFRLNDEAELAHAVASARPQLQDFELTAPLSERRMAGPWPAGAAFELAKGVYQLRPRRPVRGGVHILWGPIFVRV